MARSTLLPIERCISNRISGQKKRRQIRFPNETAKQLGRVPRTTQRGGEVAHQLFSREWAAVGEASLEMIPDLFVGVEFWRIGGEAFDMESGMASPQSVKRGSLVNGTAVPDQDDVSAEMPQQQSQERFDLEVRDVVEVQMAVESEALSSGTDTDRGDGRDLFVTVTMVKDRGLSAGSPRSPHRGREHEPAFIQKNQVRLQSAAFFLISTQR